MTCRHALCLIDTGPFADYSTSHLEAAWSHARACPTCGPALRMSHTVTDQLRGLAQPPAPPNIGTTVMARIARLETPALHEDAPQLSGQNRPVRLGWNGWLSAACLTAGVLIVAATSGARTVGQLTWSLRPGMEDLIAVSSVTVVALTIGLVSYLVGLMMPLWQRRA